MCAGRGDPAIEAPQAVGEHKALDCTAEAVEVASVPSVDICEPQSTPYVSAAVETGYATAEPTAAASERVLQLTVKKRLHFGDEADDSEGNVGTKRTKISSDAIASSEQQTSQLKQQLNPIYNLFHSMVDSQIVCSSCGHCRHVHVCSFKLIVKRILIASYSGAVQRFLSKY
jgi:hypothetical protein